MVRKKWMGWMDGWMGVEFLKSVRLECGVLGW